MLRLLVYGYLAGIAIGALLLALPWAQATFVSPLNCLFTATSAATLTGLVVVSTAGAWSPFGQVVILLLMQAGGLAMMIAGALIALQLGRRLGLSTGGPMRGAGASPQGARVVRFVLLGTMAVEAAGALGLALLLRVHHGHTWAAALAEGAFTSVSAFCNAGFVLTPGMTSLQPYAGNPWLLLVVSLLAVLGSLGVITFAEVARRGRERRLSLQTKLVLLTTGAVLLLGMLGFLFFEGWVMHPRQQPGQTVATAWFMSVTTRTAGFTPVPLEALSPPTMLVFALLMLVGGSPAGTAGGVKTTTLAIILATILTLLRRREDIEVYGRRIGRETVRLALSLMGTYIVGLLAATMGISLIEITLRPEAPLGLTPDAYYMQVLFETLSAYTNTGLTSGITPHLQPVSKAILILAMVAGRLGPLAFVHRFARARKPQLRQLPDEPVMVG